MTVLIMATQMCMANDSSNKAFEMNKMLGRGVNFGNCFESPNEGAWGIRAKEEYFDIIKQAGFNSVRLPVKWTGHTMAENPNMIEPNFLKRIDEVIGYAISRKMPIIINMHNYKELELYPNSFNKERFLALWKQLSEHYKDYPDLLLFEILNEPDDAMTPELWNVWLKDALAVIRQTNPNRIIVVDAANDAWITYLKLLELPENDRNIIVSVHHYFPHALTHQGASWITRAKADQALIDMKVVGQNPETDGGDYNNWPGTKWTGTEKEKKLMTEIFDGGARWGKEHNRPINLGEFGAYKKADMDSRVAWTKLICDTAVKNGWSLDYWEFCADFGLYDPQAKTWRKPLLDAVLGMK